MVVVVSLILSQAQKCRATRPEQTGGCRGGRERKALRPEAAAAWPRGLQGPRSACFAATAERTALPRMGKALACIFGGQRQKALKTRHR